MNFKEKNMFENLCIHVALFPIFYFFTLFAIFDIKIISNLPIANLIEIFKMENLNEIKMNSSAYALHHIIAMLGKIISSLILILYIGFLFIKKSPLILIILSIVFSIFAIFDLGTVLFNYMYYEIISNTSPSLFTQETSKRIFENNFTPFLSYLLPFRILSGIGLPFALALLFFYFKFYKKTKEITVERIN